MRTLLLASTLLLAFGCGAPSDPAANKEAGKSSSSSSAQTSDRVNTLIAGMSIEEKVGQMTQMNIDLISVGELYNLEEPHKIDEGKLKTALIDYHVGSILNVGGHTYTREHWNEIMTAIQDMAVNETSHGIPVLYGIDAIHGVNYTMGSTLFPQQLAQAATWNPSLVEQAASITAYETRASGIPWNFSPVLDLARQPLWSRYFETYGEDVHLAKAMAEACIRGYEGDDISNPEKVASCMKHFLGYSWSFTGKDRTPAYIPERQLREYFLPTFQTAIATGAHTVMINSGELNGEPVHASHDILTTLLRDELGFEGLAVTDWEDIIKLHKMHKVAPTLKEAVRMSIMAGIDMAMVPNDYDFTELLIELVKEGAVPESRLDESVARILNVKEQLGLFEMPNSAASHEYPKFGGEEHAQVAYNAAAEAVTLLKNDNSVLPLTGENILIAGPAANSLNILNGAWTHTWQGVDPQYNPKDKQTIMQALSEQIGNGASFVECSTLDSITDLDKAGQYASKADAIVVCLGELPSTEKPGDIEDLTMPEAQLQVVEKLATYGKPIVLVLVENRPRLVNRIEPLCDAIVMAYEPGNEGGRAVADVLTGNVNPSGKLPFTYPRNSASLIMYDHKYTETLDASFGHNAFNPQWHFGHGMSYTAFEYSNLSLSSATLGTDGSITASVTVTNTGELAGKEVVQLFVTDEYASITPSVKRLRGFKKIALEAGASETVEFTLSADDLAFVDHDLKWITEEGAFTARVAQLSAEFEYTTQSQQAQ